jgi:hypothetical protein
LPKLWLNKSFRSDLSAPTMTPKDLAKNDFLKLESCIGCADQK